MMFYLITQRPMQSLAGALTMLAGLVVFAISRGSVAVSCREDLTAKASWQQKQNRPAFERPSGLLKANRLRI